MRRERTFVVPKCLNPDCRNDACPGYGGNCGSCGQSYRRRMNAGTVTKDQLIDAGLWRPKPIDRVIRKAVAS
jgi:hypothetical protein